MGAKRRACFFILLAAALWGVVGIFVRRLNAAGFSAMQIVAIRIAVPAIADTLFLLAADRSSLCVRLRDCYLFVLTGVCSFALFNWCYFNAIEASSLGAAAILLYTAPAIVNVLSVWVFRERLTLRKGIAVAATFLGCVLVTGVGAETRLSVRGIVFGLGSGVGYALYTVFSKLALKKYSSRTVTVYTFLFAAAAAIPLAGFDGKALALFAQPSVLLLSLGIGSLCCLFPYLFYAIGLSQIEAGTAAVMAMLEPVVAALLGIFLYQEAFDIRKAAGIVLIVAAVVAQRPRSEKQTSAGS